MAKVSSFIIGTLAVALIITLFNVYLGGVNEGYTNSGYDSTEFEAYNKLDELNEQSKDVKDEVSEIKEKPNALDVIGGFFTSGYNALRLTFSSFGVFDSMLDTAMDQSNLGQTGEYLKIALGTMLIILIFIGVVVSAILKYGV